MKHSTKEMAGHCEQSSRFLGRLSLSDSKLASDPMHGSRAFCVKMKIQYVSERVAPLSIPGWLQSVECHARSQLLLATVWRRAPFTSWQGNGESAAGVMIQTDRNRDGRNRDGPTEPRLVQLLSGPSS
jgi:hypothetical protein